MSHTENANRLPHM